MQLHRNKPASRGTRLLDRFSLLVSTPWKARPTVFERARSALFIVLVLCLSGRPAVSDQFSGEFTDAVAAAQKRTVKIYGAAIGREAGYASGLIVSGDGQILTAQGIYLASDRIRVTLPDGTTHLAQVLRRSEPLQAALLKIDVATPDYFQLSQQGVVRTGDWVLAISNSFKVADGPEPLSVNLGVISLRTQIDAKFGTQDVAYRDEMLLLDAITSNPGAAGGAVVTADGRLAGMIGKIIESKSTNTRLNYAVPADLLARFLSGSSAEPPSAPALTGGKAELGIRLFSLGGRRAPAYVDRILPNSPAANAGLQSDDLIVAVAGTVVRSISDYDRAVETLVPGQEIMLAVKRRQQLIDVPITPVVENGKD